MAPGQRRGHNVAQCRFLTESRGVATRRLSERPPIENRTPGLGLLVVGERRSPAVRLQPTGRVVLLASIRSRVAVQGVGPAIGFPLSDRHLADVAFWPTTSLAFYRAETYKGITGSFGPWWTVALGPLADESITQEGEAETTAGGLTMLPWPRLTLREVHSLAQEAR